MDNRRLTECGRIRRSMKGVNLTHVRMRQSVNRETDIQDALGSLSDRADLERLFDRKVGMTEVLRLVGKGIGPKTILGLLESPDPNGAIRKLLSS